MGGRMDGWMDGVVVWYRNELMTTFTEGKRL